MNMSILLFHSIPSIATVRSPKARLGYFLVRISSEEQQHLYSESFPLFPLQHHSDMNPQDWQYSSPEKVCAARADIDDNMLAEFGGYACPQHAFYNRPSSIAGAAGAQSQWVANLIVECARAVAVSNARRVKNLLWVLNEISSPYGDADQRLAACFLQALFCRVTGTGVSCHRILSAAAEKTYSFGTLRKMILDYQASSLPNRKLRLLQLGLFFLQLGLGVGSSDGSIKLGLACRIVSRPICA